MADELNYRKLCDLYRDEKGTNELVKLEPTFEDDALSMLDCMRKENGSSREVENASRILKCLLRLRRQKVVFRGLQENARHEDTVGMTNYEHAVFDRICQMRQEEDKRVLCALGQSMKHSPPDNGKSAGGSGGKKDSKQAAPFKKLRILKDVPAYKGADGQTYGPYKIGQEVPVPEGEADWMVKGKLAQNL